MLEAIEPPLSLKYPSASLPRQAPTRTVANRISDRKAVSQTYANKPTRHAAAVTIIYTATTFVSGTPINSK